MEKKKDLADYINARLKQEQKESGEWIDRIMNSDSREETLKVIREYNKKKFGL